MVNSIREKLDESDTISEIRLMLGHNPSNICVVVEGVDDYQTFTNLFCKNVFLIQSYASCIGIDKIILDFYDNNRVIGIRDKDYLVSPINDHCFFCDYCCREMMLISIDSCYERLFVNYYKGTDYNSDELREYCLHHLEFISKLRLLNYTNNWKIRFDGLKPAKVYDFDETVMNSNTIRELNRMNPDNTITQEQITLCNQMPKCKSALDLYNITNGHDFLNLFCKLCNIKHGQTSIDGASTTLRGTFGVTEFQKTALYNNLVLYQVTHNLHIVN